jgi:hypothetical protein
MEKMGLDPSNYDGDNYVTKGRVAPWLGDIVFWTGRSSVSPNPHSDDELRMAGQQVLEAVGRTDLGVRISAWEFPITEVPVNREPGYSDFPDARPFIYTSNGNIYIGGFGAHHRDIYGWAEDEGVDELDYYSENRARQFYHGRLHGSENPELEWYGRPGDKVELARVEGRLNQWLRDQGKRIASNFPVIEAPVTRDRADSDLPGENPFLYTSDGNIYIGGDNSHHADIYDWGGENDIADLDLWNDDVTSYKGRIRTPQGGKRSIFWYDYPHVVSDIERLRVEGKLNQWLLGRGERAKVTRIATVHVYDLDTNLEEGPGDSEPWIYDTETDMFYYGLGRGFHWNLMDELPDEVVDNVQQAYNNMYSDTRYLFGRVLFSPQGDWDVETYSSWSEFKQHKDRIEGYVKDILERSPRTASIEDQIHWVPASDRHGGGLPFVYVDGKLYVGQGEGYHNELEVPWEYSKELRGRIRHTGDIITYVNGIKTPSKIVNEVIPYLRAAHPQIPETTAFEDSVLGNKVNNNPFYKHLNIFNSLLPDRSDPPKQAASNITWLDCGDTHGMGHPFIYNVGDDRLYIGKHQGYHYELFDQIGDSSLKDQYEEESEFDYMNQWGYGRIEEDDHAWCVYLDGPERARAIQLARQALSERISKVAQADRDIDGPLTDDIAQYVLSDIYEPKDPTMDWSIDWNDQTNKDQYYAKTADWPPAGLHPVNIKKPVPDSGFAADEYYDEYEGEEGRGFSEGNFRFISFIYDPVEEHLYVRGPDQNHADIASSDELDPWELMEHKADFGVAWYRGSCYRVEHNYSDYLEGDVLGQQYDEDYEEPSEEWKTDEGIIATADRLIKEWLARKINAGLLPDVPITNGSRFGSEQNPQVTPQEIVDLTLKVGGTTTTRDYHLVQGGWFIGRPDRGESIKLLDFTVEKLLEYRERNSDQEYFGTWYDEERGYIDLDCVVISTNKEDAIDWGVGGNQFAVWNDDQQEELDVRPHYEYPYRFPGTASVI